MKRLTKEQALTLLKSADLLGLGQMADKIRKNIRPEGIVSFIINSAANENCRIY